MPRSLGRSLSSIEKSIADAQQKLTDLYRQRKDLEALVLSFQSTPFVQSTLHRLESDFQKMESEPDVAWITIVDKGIHVKTQPIEIEHEGARYMVGAFVIRVSEDGHVSVWSEQPAHPKGIPHPHIAKDGGPCLGNASDVIARAAGEHRYYDTVKLVLRWLKDGYTPELASVKIEEWPVVAAANPIDSSKASRKEAETHDRVSA